MIWLDVDTAVTVPVNVAPLIDDTDFKTRETGVAYNAAGMDLVWNLITPAGTITQTAVTPTTAGDYDWTEIGDAMYKIEIPASGGASINNNTEGFGWFSGVITGILPFRGPTIGFRAAGLNNALVEGAYSATRGLAGTALPAVAAGAAGGIPTDSTGKTSFNDLSAAQVNAECDTALTDYDAPTKAELDSGLAGLNDPTAAAIADAVLDEALSGHTTAGTLGKAIGDGVTAWVTATGFSTHSAADVWAAETRTLTANTNLNDPTATAIADAVLDEALSGHTTAGTLGKAIGDGVTAWVTATGFSTHSAADVWTSGTRTLTANTNLNDPTAAQVATAVFTTQLTESYRSANTAGTVAQYLHEIIAHLGEFAIASTTKTTKRLDGTTTAKTYTFDSDTAPTSITEAT